MNQLHLYGALHMKSSLGSPMNIVRWWYPGTIVYHSTIGPWWPGARRRARGLSATPPAPDAADASHRGRVSSYEIVMPR